MMDKFLYDWVQSLDPNKVTIKEWDAYLKGKQEAQNEILELREKIRELEQVIRLIMEER